MSLKSIRESYSKLLATFNDAGMKLNESQKSDLDTFVLALESSMSKQRESAIRKTKKAVTEKLEAEYKQLFESIMQNITRNNELNSKILKRKTKINESKKLATKVNDYLELYVESVLPKKTIVDYDRMQKLEKVHESLQDLLLVNEDTVEAKKIQLDESFKLEKGKLETELAKMHAKLNESMKQTQAMKRKVSQYKAMDLLESKTKDLPSYEARQIKKRFENSTCEEIENKFDKVYESVSNRVAESTKEDEIALESAIEKIVDEDDILTASPHNGKGVHNKHLLETETCPKCGENPCVCDKNDENFETTETVNFDDDGDVQLDESEVIDQNIMKWYCSQV